MILADGAPIVGDISGRASEQGTEILRLHTLGITQSVLNRHLSQHFTAR
jgi:hypothetical protein